MNKKVALSFIYIFLAVLFIITISGYSLKGKETGEIFRLIGKIDKITGGDFKVPLSEEHPVIYAFIREHSVIKNGPYFITIRYGLEKRDLLESHQEIEESQDISILYGPYEGTSPIMIEYSPLFKERRVSGVNEIGNWNINGKEVEYYHFAREGGEAIIFHLDLNGGGAQVTYFLSNQFTKEDARSFTAFLLKEMN